MATLVFDIETIGKDWDSLDSAQQEYLLQYADTEEEQQRVRESLGLSPLTGEVVAIGVLNPESLKGAVYFQAPGSELAPFEEDGISYETGSEEQLLRWFWEVVRSYDRFVTFNGRGFDCPFLLVRSAVQRVEPTRRLMGNRYGNDHVDLMDRLSFFGATRRRYSLDMWCRTLGIHSPKGQGISGRDVGRFFGEGRFAEIARYCARDLQATRQLFELWERYIGQ